MSTAEEPQSTRPRRRWCQFSVTTLMLGITLLCLWLGDRVNPIRRLQQRLRDPSDQIRAEAVHKLGTMGEDAEWAERSVLTALHDESPLVRQTAAWAISRIGSDVEALTPLLDDGDQDVRLAAAESILRGDGNVQAAVSALIGLAHLESAIEDIMEALSPEMASKAIPPIFEALTSEEPTVAEAANNTLRNLPVPSASATQTLLKYLDRDEWWLRVTSGGLCLDGVQRRATTCDQIPAEGRDEIGSAFCLGRQATRGESKFRFAIHRTHGMTCPSANGSLEFSR
ncbi:MAG TPA: HEAT repeat domain-containing protein [Pirellulales bacterium]|nr:HEAT repeat domain-containing protein [Pirellulales bacterium]